MKSPFLVLMPMTHHLQHIIAAEASRSADLPSAICHLPSPRPEAVRLPDELSHLALSEMQRLQDRVQAFQRRTFPKQPVAGKLNHLIREATELRDSPDDITEWADVLNLLLGAAAQYGHDAQDLILAGHLKCGICEQRQWPAQPDAEGVYHHLES